MTDFYLANVHDGDGFRPVLVRQGKALDLRKALDLKLSRSLEDVFDDWEALEPRLVALADCADGWESWEDLVPASPVQRPHGVFCVGANYSDHVYNMCEARGIPQEPDPHEVGMPPYFFLKTASTLTGHGARITLDSEALDWEPELAVIIGRKARNVSLDDALSYVAGYTIANDLSARDRTLRPNSDPSSIFSVDFVSQKVFDQSCPLGPFVLPARFISDPQNLDIKLWVGDRLRNDSNTSRMIFAVAEQIAALSVHLTLHPGDVILTGTPAGVGAETGDKLSRGDVVRTAIQKLGEQEVTII